MSGYLAKHILVIDDDSHIQLKNNLEVIYPESTISAFSNLQDAITYIDDCDALGHPDAIITDCSDHGQLGEMGLRNGRAIAKWYQDNTNALPAATMIFISKDVPTAQKVANQLKGEIGLEAIAGNANEFGAYKRVAQGKIERFSSPDEHNGFRDFIHHTAGLNLPVTQDEIDAALIANEDYQPQDIIRMMKEGKFDVAEGLKIIEPHLHEAIDKNYALDVVIEGLPEGIFPEDTETDFSEGVGQPVTGDAAYSIDDVQALARQGKKSVFIMNEYTPDFIPHLQHISGVVMISNEGTGHLKSILISHGISGVFGMSGPVDLDDKYRETASRVVFDDGIIKAHRKLDTEEHHDSTQHRTWIRTIELYPDYKRYINDEINDFDPDQVDYELIWNIHTDISAGTSITIDPTGNYQKKLYGVHLPIKEKHSDLDNKWVDDLKDLLAEWKKTNNIYMPAFRANIDGVDQMPQALSLAQGIGLVRTEHMVLKSESQMAAYKKAVLEQDNSAFENLAKLQAKDFSIMLSALDSDFPIKIRLIDAPLSEFTPKEKNSFSSLYGDEGIRGVQLAEQIPELYISQIDAIFTGLKEARKPTWLQDREIPGASGPVEIMVPTIRTTEELTFVLFLVRSSAQEHGFTKADYRFGTMLETLDACNNIEAIVPYCDFICIGSNDLTSEALKCSRDDWERRRDLTVKSGLGADPFITIHNDVLKLIFDSVYKARTIKPDIDISICGDHAADETSLIKMQPLRLSSASMPPIKQYLHGLKTLYEYSMITKFLDFAHQMPSQDSSYKRNYTP